MKGAVAATPAARAPASAPRITPINRREQVAEADRAVFDAVAESRGNVRGPYSVLMHSPQLCSKVFDLSNYLRSASLLPSRLRELATIATAREKDCPYVWAAHAPAARREGIHETTIAAVRDRDQLQELPKGDRQVIQYVRELCGAHRVQQPLFDALREDIGVPRLVELTALAGHYCFIADMLNAAEIRPTADAEALP